jgi:hypothetical protein
MWEIRNSYKFWLVKLQENRPLRHVSINGKAILKWITEKYYVHWIQLAQDRIQCQAFVNMVMNLQILRSREFWLGEWLPTFQQKRSCTMEVSSFGVYESVNHKTETLSAVLMNYVVTCVVDITLSLWPSYCDVCQLVTLAEDETINNILFVAYQKQTVLLYLWLQI